MTTALKIYDNVLVSNHFRLRVTYCIFSFDALCNGYIQTATMRAASPVYYIQHRLTFRAVGEIFWLDKLESLSAGVATSERDDCIFVREF